ncbi:hypothetical protein EXN66_Car015845 [Channa argus]|uniref:Uncharacterized protein n=1 Tax=Channa argus TaxID=215402 RepID=A0A6G1QD21_CHAAH|nr:hypothetical protein EXN66_Car015845 [Channa argus]
MFTAPQQPKQGQNNYNTKNNFHPHFLCCNKTSVSFDCGLSEPREVGQIIVSERTLSLLMVCGVRYG